MPSISDVLAGYNFASTQFSTAALSGTTASAGQLTGSQIVVMDNSGANPGTYTTRTATLMIADAGLFVNQQWIIILSNSQGTGVLTLAGGTGVTVSGTATVATNTTRVYRAQVTSVTSPAITITNLFSFTATAWALGA